MSIRVGLRHMSRNPGLTTKELFVFPGIINPPTVWASIDYYAVAKLLNNQDSNVFFTFKVPHNFTSLVRCSIVVISVMTGNMYNLYQVHYASEGEDRNKHFGSKGSVEEAVTAFKITELPDFSEVFPDLAKGDYIGVYFYREGTHAKDTAGEVGVLGLLFEYR